MRIYAKLRREGGREVQKRVARLDTQSEGSGVQRGA